MKKLLCLLAVFLWTQIAYAVPPAPTVSNEAYDATAWNGISTISPSKDAVRDKIESLPSLASDAIWDAAGDLVQGTGANTAAKLTKGAEGTILRAGPVSNAYSTSIFADTYAKGTFLYNAAANTVAGFPHPAATYSILYTNAIDTAAWFPRGAASSVLSMAGDGLSFSWATSLNISGITFAEVDGHTDATNLTATQVSRTLINSYGRTGAATLNLPAAASGFSFVAIVGTKHNSAWKILRNGANTIYWDSGGVLTPGKTYFQETNQEIGSRVSCSTFQTGAATWSWMCGAVSGTWATD